MWYSWFCELWPAESLYARFQIRKFVDLQVAIISLCSLCCTDLIEQRLEIAKKLGADFCITSSTKETPEQLAERIESVVGHKADQTTECTGAAPCISTAIYVSAMPVAVLRALPGM